MDRMNSETILGARLWIAKMGATITEGSATNKVSKTSMPAAPTSDNAGPWLQLGRIRTFKPTRDQKESEIEGVEASGKYKTHKMRQVTSRKFEFSTNDVTPEAWQLAFGLKDAIADGTEQTLGASATDKITCWLYFEATDSYADGTQRATGCCLVELSLTNDLEFKSDPAQVDYTAEMIETALETFDPSAISAAVAG